MRLLIIGGSDAGISAAVRAREIASDTQVTVVVADRYPNFSICGLPYYLSGDVPDWHALAHRSRAEIEAMGITPLLDHVATAIDTMSKTVRVQPRDPSPLGTPGDHWPVLCGNSIRSLESWPHRSLPCRISSRSSPPPSSPMV
jgi:NADPH-dependent 2,4-dienoyl-CoA reductase/sulfur reductase-like enzyme